MKTPIALNGFAERRRNRPTGDEVAPQISAKEKLVDPTGAQPSTRRLNQGLDHRSANHRLKEKARKILRLTRIARQQQGSERLSVFGPHAHPREHRGCRYARTPQDREREKLELTVFQPGRNLRQCRMLAGP
jgi:hypothetical protein